MTQGADSTTGTILQGKGNDRRTLIEIGSKKVSWNSEVPGSKVDITSPFIPAGSRTFEVEDASKFSVGDNIIIRHPSTDKWLAAVDYGSTHGDVDWQPGEICAFPQNLDSGLRCKNV